MNKRTVRVYADTSVYGGAFDEEYREPSLRFFEQVRVGRFGLVTSTVVRNELADAPEAVRNLFNDLLGIAEIVDVSEEALRLQTACLTARVLSTRWETDALHVALATVSQARLIVSWNFKHIVNFQKIPVYNGVNQSLGYAPVGIHTPQEVVADEDEDV